MIENRKKFFVLSGILVLASIVSLFLWQLNLGVEFTGGSKLRVSFEEERPQIEAIKDKVSDLDLGGYSVQPVEEKGFVFRFKDISEEQHQLVLSSLEELDAGLREEDYTSIGASIGEELREKAYQAIILSLIAVVLYISWAFRKVSQPVSSWKYGVVAICALFHDVLVTVGVFSVLGHFFGVEIGVAFVAAVLTIVGYSVNDTIVIFDRVRENILKGVGENFEKIVSLSASQSITRSINTSLTTLLVLLAIFFFGAETITYFTLALMIGVALGTYSSLFVASPLIVEWEKASKN